MTIKQKEKRRMKKLKPLRDLRKKLWKLVSEHTRKQDADKNGMVRCVTCGTRKHWKNMHCGHYLHGCLDYHAKNIHPQCPRCNKWLHGNLTEYALYLTKRYGDGILEELHQAKLDEPKYTREQIEALIEFYKETKEKNNGNKKKLQQSV